MATLLQHQPARVTRGVKVKLQAHRNEEQRESKAQIVTLQKALDKPLHNKGLSLAAEASFTIMDLRDELMFSREIMQTVVRDRSSPWKRAVETLLTRKKQFLEDITKKQILNNRWKLEERERQDTVHTLWIQTGKPLLDQGRHAHTGRIGDRGIPSQQGLLWVVDGPDSADDLEQWAQVYLQQHGQPEYVIQQVTMRTIVIHTTSLPEMRALLQQSMT
jgi:hypothetical protein